MTSKLCTFRRRVRIAHQHRARKGRNSHALESGLKDQPINYVALLSFAAPKRR
jgi:hypothetical protein